MIRRLALASAALGQACTAAGQAGAEATSFAKPHSHAHADIVHTVKPGAPVRLVADPVRAVEVGDSVALPLALHVSAGNTADRVRVVSWPSDGLDLLPGNDPVATVSATRETVLRWDRQVRATQNGRQALNLRAEWLDPDGQVVSVRSFAVRVPVGPTSAQKPSSGNIARDAKGRAIKVLPAQEIAPQQ